MLFILGGGQKGMTLWTGPLEEVGTKAPGQALLILRRSLGTIDHKNVNGDFLRF